ncbi:MAG: response regulator [Dehalococcoidales bacterium]|nr:response regulator [Dehalococcoidales bacterium]
MAGKRILVVEDHPLNRELVSDLLLARGYEVLEATTGQQALEMGREHRPDLILMDVQLPELDGLSATRILKSDPATQDIVVVAITAHAMRGDEAKVYDAGCSGYISKPINTRELPKIIEQFLPKG